MSSRRSFQGASARPAAAMLRSREKFAWAATRIPFVSWRDGVHPAQLCQLRQSIDANPHIVIDLNFASIDFFELAFHIERFRGRGSPRWPHRPCLIANLERLGVVRSCE